MKTFRTFAVFVLIVCQSPTVLAESVGTRVFAQAAKSIVKVVHGWPTIDTQGSGVVVDENLVATNCHVIRGAPRIYIDAGTNPRIVAKLQYSDTERDLCFLFAADLDAPKVSEISWSVPPPGTRVFAIGAPLGLDLTLSEGIVSGLRQTRSTSVIQTTAAISPGSSGGGLFDETGALVGITTAQMRQGQNLNFAVPLDSLRRWLDAYRVARRGARLAVGASRFPPHVEVSLAPRMYRDPIDSINSSRYVASAIRLTSKYVATVCSAVGVTSWPLKKTQHYVLSNGMYLTQADQSWVIKADLPKDVCIGDIAAVPNQVPSVSIGQSIAVARGDAVFAFVDPMSAKSLAFGIVEETYPADPGYGQLLTVRFSSPIGIGSGVFTQDGKLVGMVARREDGGLIVLNSVEGLLVALQDAASLPQSAPARRKP
ncbi:MAG: serine protease [Sterolibacteriaceae bacterium]|uniref:Serine protease n=1 Tax=Candidatus Methylophosphatis roskildensis TaxID=2899263 RepID=A0A9D7HK47_9PROT|nr:serine protease [Candidatus Methylophosphatis roskildensis]MBK7235814.1 serine protease [Sterolibacteriaceae bacterium]